jgi:four helix bundle protein
MENKENKKVRSFTDLFVWQEAHKLVLMIYKTTKEFPAEEKYSLIDQMRRCAISISSNIAEGFSRQSKKEKVQFYHVAKGSLTELQNQLLVAKDVEYINKKKFHEIAEQTVQTHKLLNGLIRSSNNP